MSKLRNKLITVLAVLFCALLCLSTVLIIPKSKTADAYTNTSTPATSVNELYSSSTHGFSAKNLRTLYGKLFSGVTKYDTVATKLSQQTNSQMALADKEIIVEFGSMKWIAVYLSTAQQGLGGVTADQSIAGYADNGDIVLTLWLASSTQTAQWQYASPTDDAYVSNSKFPANMYGISYMRSVILNNGGKYYYDRYNLQDNTNGPQTGNPFERFTMPKSDVSNSVIDYLVAPRYISWQYQQATRDVGTDNNLANDSWGKLQSGTFYDFEYQGFYQSKGWDQDYYQAWKDDLIWLPSIGETGEGATGVNAITGKTKIPGGFWRTTTAQRQTQSGSWTRTCNPMDANTGVVDPARHRTIAALGSGGTRQGILVGADSLVRPAIHLNLTKVAKEAKGVSFDAVQLTNVDEGTTVAYDDSDGEHTFTTVYNTDDVKVKLLENAYLDVTEDYMGDNSTASIATFSNGEFIANKPKKDADETYIIKVTPKTDTTDGKKYVWDGDDTSDPKYYKIKIKRAEMDVGWQGFNAQLGDNLLRPDSEITVLGNLADAQLEVRYYIVEPNSTNPPPTNTADWTLRTTGTDPTVNAAGTYVVHYEIKANYHNTKKSSYNVSVGVDNVTITADGSAGEAVYFKGGVENLTQQNWIDKIKTAITVTKNGQPYDSVDTLLGNLEVVLKTRNGNNYTDAVKNGQDCYDVGTYYLDLKFKNGASQAIQFSWANNDRPTFEIKQDTITVKVVADSDDGLTHVYGDPHAAMKFELMSGGTTLPDGGELNDLEFGDYILKVGDDEIVLDETTPVGDGKVIADVSNIKNYKVQFETSGSAYSVTQREVKLKVVDKSLGYGVILDPSTVQLTFEDGESLVNNELLSNVITSITYTIKSNAGASFNLNQILPIAEYILSARAEADNYKFEITAGKLTITKANYKMDDVTLDNVGYVYDEQPHPANIENLPSDEITVSYRYVNYDTGEELDGPPVEVGLYLVYATFSHENNNYNPITDVLAAYIRIAYSPDALNEPYPPLPTDEELAAAADLAKKKTEAKKTLDEEAKAKKDEIDADVNLSAEEKKAAKDEIDKELKEGNAAIDKAKDKDGVDKAYDDGKKEIEDTTELAQKKGAAKSELDKAAQAKKDAIDNNPDLTDEEKAAAKAEVDKELEEGKKAIDGANSIDGVSSAESSTKTNIENIKAEHKGSFPWWILAIIAGALVLVTVLIIVIVKRRNADDDDGGYDDFYDDEYDYDEEEVEDDGDEAFGY